MRKFTQGFFSGVAVMTIGAGLFSLAAANQNTSYDWPEADTSLADPITGGLTNLKLAKERPDLEWNMLNILKDDYSAMNVTALASIMDFKRPDIKSLCIGPYGGAYEGQVEYIVDINLSSEAKSRLGNALAERDNQEITINLLGLPINGFFADAEKARLFAASEEEEKDLADISFIFNKRQTYATLTFLSSLTGTNEFTSCEPTFDIQAMPGYQYHQDWWGIMKDSALKGEPWPTRPE